jgi:esterase
MDLHFEAYGHGRGEPLIILHGLLGSADNWHSVGSKLAPSLQVFSLDQRNHGRSPHSFEMDYAVMAEDVRHFIKSQGISEAFVMGHSMGGKTAMQLALGHPMVVRKLIIVDMSPRPYSPRHREILARMLSLDLSHFQTRQQMEAALAPAVDDLSTRRFLLKNAVREDSGGFRWRIGLEEILQNLPQLTAAVSSDRPFEKPALFIRGEKSDYLFEDDWPLIQRLFPQASLQTIRGAGHLVHVEETELFVKSVLEFLLQAAQRGISRISKP